MENAHTDVESVPFHVVSECRSLDMDFDIYPPLVFNGLYNEPKCWTDRVHVFVHQSLDDRGLSGIVQSS